MLRACGVCLSSVRLWHRKLTNCCLRRSKQPVAVSRSFVKIQRTARYEDAPSRTIPGPHSERESVHPKVASLLLSTNKRTTTIPRRQTSYIYIYSYILRAYKQTVADIDGCCCPVHSPLDAVQIKPPYGTRTRAEEGVID